VTAGASDATMDVREVAVPGLDARVRVFRGDDGWNGLVDTYAIVGTRRVVFVDAHATPSQARTVRELCADALAGREATLVLTHADFDHAWGACAFPCTIVAHRICAERLAGDEARAELADYQARYPWYADVVLVTPTVAVEGGHVIDAGGIRVELVAAAGHCADHLAVWLPELGVLLAGDAAESPFPHVHDRAGLAEEVRTLARLRALGARLVLPSHGRTADPELLDRNTAYIAAVRAHADATRPVDWATRGDLPEAVGFPLADAARQAGVDPATLAPYYADFHRDAVRAACDEHAALRV